MSRPAIRLRIDFGPGRALGPGKVDLLEAMARRGSLSAAATEMKMSYKRAWDLLQSLNRTFDGPVATMSKGGSGGGGGATLTLLGKTVIAAYRAAESRSAQAVAHAFDGLHAPRLVAGRKRPTRPAAGTTTRQRGPGARR